MMNQLWRSLKVARRIGLGPASLVFRFERTPPVARVPLAERYVAAPDFGAALTRPHEASTPRADEHSCAGVAESALIVGAGPGLGEALAHRLCSSGFHVSLAARNGKRLAALAQGLRQRGGSASAYACDATDEISMGRAFDQVIRDSGSPHLVVYSLQEFGPGGVDEVELPAFESAWRHNCLGSFLVSRLAARAMAARGQGTIVLIGSTSSRIGREGHLNLAVGKFGQRALAQVLARELWPKGVHVAHVLIDADIREGEEQPHVQAQPEDIAKTILFLHRQPRSAWTSELDLRPSSEAFWEHC